MNNTLNANLMRWNSETTLCKKKVTRLFHFQFSFMFIEVCQQTVASGGKTKQGIKMGHKWKRVTHKLTEDREAENKITYFLEFKFFSSTPLFYFLYLDSQQNLHFTVVH